jgi:o-aminophenol oxidase
MSPSANPPTDVVSHRHGARADAGTPGGRLTKFRDPLQIPPVVRARPGRPLTIRMRNAKVRLHSELPLTPVWTYEGTFPGPTIEVRRGERIRVMWRNELTGPLPFPAVEVPLPSALLPGSQGVPPRADVAKIPPWTVVHLHGAVTGGGNDGWTENGVSPGDAQLSEYPNDQPSGTFWYHDHAMAITRWNVYAGLAGMYLIRDGEEDALNLPGGAREVPLVLCDRNLEVGPGGELTGQLLYKVGLAPPPATLSLPFQGPYTLVNGTIWPHLKVSRRWYRFRLLNASNARVYQLELRAGDGTTLSGAMRQIGTDSGLLPEPVALNRLILTPGERADVLIDFAPFGGQSITMVNTMTPPPEPGTTTPNPDVMQFRVKQAPAIDSCTLPRQLSPSYVRLDHGAAPDHGHRWLVLTPPGPGHPGMWEMVRVDPATVTLPSEGIIQVKQGNDTITLRRVARHMHDAINFVIARESWEQWSILHIGGPAGGPPGQPPGGPPPGPPTGPPHPMHIHLVRFQTLVRERCDTAGFDRVLGGTRTPIVLTGTDSLEPNETGWKDVVPVPPDSLVRVLGQFGGATGKFMYHCHTLEHEDELMMRPFVVLPAEVKPLVSHLPDEHAHMG